MFVHTYVRARRKVHARRNEDPPILAALAACILQKVLNVIRLVASVVAQIPDQREQRFCSSSQESGTTFIYCRRVCIINYYYLGRWWGYVHQRRTDTYMVSSAGQLVPQRLEER